MKFSFSRAPTTPIKITRKTHFNFLMIFMHFHYTTSPILNKQKPPFGDFYRLPSPKLIIAAVVRHIARHTNPEKLELPFNDERKTEGDKGGFPKPSIFSCLKSKNSRWV